MKKSNKKRNKFIHGILFAVIICFLGVVFYNKLCSIHDYNKQISSLKAQISEQEEYGKKLDKETKQYSTKEYVEKYARKLGLIKSNEKIFKNYNDKK